VSLEAHIAARRLREKELCKAGATPAQAYAIALEEAWRKAALENERLWDREARRTAARVSWCTPSRPSVSWRTLAFGLAVSAVGFLAGAVAWWRA
jgi:hypothetical protein